MKPKWIDAYMDTAERFAQLSYAVRLKVGAVIVKDNRIISIGYNGTPAGWDNVCEERVGTSLKTKPVVTHAEMNAILKLASSGESGKGATLFLTHAPCIECSKAIYGAGIVEMYYRHEYRDRTGLDFLECFIPIHKV